MQNPTQIREITRRYHDYIKQKNEASPILIRYCLVLFCMIINQIKCTPLST